jgi:hypothetical protein
LKGEVKVVQRVVWIAEGGLFPPALQQTLAAPVQLVGDQTREQINRRHGLGLGLVQSSFQHGGDATEPELSQRAF